MSFLREKYGNVKNSSFIANNIIDTIYFINIINIFYIIAIMIKSQKQRRLN